MKIEEKIKNWIKETLKVEVDFVVEHPVDLKNGDYSTNIAMVLAGKEKKNPKELASEFGKTLNENIISEIERIEAVGGFINFYLSKNFFENSVKEILDQGKSVGQNNLFKNQKIIIEYTDPNPFKEFHIGHLMSNAIGEAISRLVKAGGAEVKRLSYGGDVGLHVAKAIFGVLYDKEKLEHAKKSSKQDQIKFWAEMYVFGNNKYEDDVLAKEKIDALNKIIFEKSDPEINKLYDWGREISIDYFLEMFKKLDTHFDKNIWESEVAEEALKAVDLGLQKNILEKSDGAIIFRGENYGLHTRVFVNSKGVPVYEAKELGLGIKKYDDFSFDRSIVITGNEQNDYFKVVLKATELIKPEVSDKTVHIGHGMLRFASGKMSSRKGNVITAEDLINQVKEKILEKIKGRDFNENEKENTAEIIAIGAIKYSILRQAIGGDIIFDFDKSISFEGDSGPYVQYTAVRANSILEKAGSAKKILSKNSSNFLALLGKKFFSKIFLQSQPNRSENFEITDLERYLYRFEEVVERAGSEYAPHYIVTYLTELASLFNSFYAKEKILDKNDPNSEYKITLTLATYLTLKTGLKLLGIKTPERM